MTMFNKSTLLSLGIALGLTVAATAAQSAATIDTWKLDYRSVPGVGNGGSASRTEVDGTRTPYTYKSQNSSHTATASGMYENGYGGRLRDGSQYLKHWSGLSFDRGSNDGSDGNDSHTVDNYGYDEIVVFEFEQAISLQSFKFGYVGADNGRTDSDTTVLYRNDIVDNGNNLAGARFSNSSLTNRGWTALAHIANVGTGTKNISSITAGIYSKTWAIGAYLSNVAASYTMGHSWGGNDGFKLAAITGVTRGGGGQVPITGTHLLLVLGLSLLLLGRSRAIGSKK